MGPKKRESVDFERATLERVASLEKIVRDDEAQCRGLVSALQKITEENHRVNEKYIMECDEKQRLQQANHNLRLMVAWFSNQYGPCPPEVTSPRNPENTSSSLLSAQPSLPKIPVPPSARSRKESATALFSQGAPLRKERSGVFVPPGVSRPK